MTGKRQSDLAQDGMSLRDYFAAMAMQAMVSKGGHRRETATDAYQMADWMLEVRDAD